FAEKGSIDPVAHGIPGTATVHCVLRAATDTRAWKYCVFFAATLNENEPPEPVVTVFVRFRLDAFVPEKIWTATPEIPWRFSVSLPDTVYLFVFFEYFALRPRRTGMFTNPRAWTVPAALIVPVPTVQGVATSVQP